MGKVRTEVGALVTKMRGKSVAVEDTKRWYKTTKSSTGDTSVQRSNEVFKPGKVYAFRYENPVVDNKMWDRNPVVLSLGRVNSLDVGINLNYLPYSKRLDLLDRVYDQFENIIERSIKLSGGNVLTQNPIKSMQYENVKAFLNKAGYMKAFRRYQTSKRSRNSIISFTEWNRVVLLELADIARGDINKAYSKTNS